MARLTVKELRKAVDIELETVWYRLVNKIATLADRQADMAMRYDRMVDQINTLTQLAKEQAETIAALTGKLEELVGDHNALAMAVKDIGDDEALNHQWLDRQQARIVALEKHQIQTFTLSSSNSTRLDTHGAWIAELFNRLNDHVNDHVNDEEINHAIRDIEERVEMQTRRAQIMELVFAELAHRVNLRINNAQKSE